MPKSLIDEPPLLVLPSLAAAIGLSEAIFLQQLHYWLDTAGHLQDDGQRWIFNSYEAWSTQFPWWNIGTIRRIVATLRDAGIIHTTTRYNKIAIDNTLWYTIDYPALDALTTPASDLPDPNPPTSAENSTPSAETNRPRAQNAQTTRAKCTDHARKMRTPIPENTTENTTETTTTVVVVDGDPPQKPISLPEKTRAHPRTRDPHPPANPHPSDTYHQANTHPAAIDAALYAAEILDPATRASILAANPDLTVEHIFAWDAYRTRTNATNGRRLGPGALVSLLRTAARPPRTRTDPAAVERWLISAGYLTQPEPSDWSDQSAPHPPIPANQPTPTPDPAAAELWQSVLTDLQLTLHAPVFHNHLRPTTAISLTPTTLTILCHNPFSQEWLEQRMKGVILRQLRRLHPQTPPLDIQFQRPPP